jgi:hypothetical protein
MTTPWTLLTAGGVGAAGIIFYLLRSRSGKASMSEILAPLNEIERLAGLIKDQHSESALVSIQAATQAEYFEVRYVEGQFRLEYQLVESFQIESEARFKAASKQAGVTTDYWGDGSDGWDKYVFARLGQDPIGASQSIEQILHHFSGLTPMSQVTMRIQDFSTVPLRSSNKSL